MAEPQVIISEETDDITVLVDTVTTAVVPLYPGSENIAANVTQNAAIAALDSVKANKSETPTLESVVLAASGAEAAQNAVAGFSGQLDGLTINQESIRSELEEVKSAVNSLDPTELQSFTVNGSDNPVFTYGDGTSSTFTGVRIARLYRGSLSAAPTVAGTMGEWFENTNPALDIVRWVCTVTGSAAGGAAPVAVWTPRGGKVYEDMAFEFVSNDSYDYPVATPRTVIAPQQWGASVTSVAWPYAVGTGAFNTAVFPLSMAAGSVLRATVTGLAAGTKRYAALARTA